MPARDDLLAVLHAAGHGEAEARRLVDAVIEAALHEYADRLDEIKPQCTALTGPVWYGDGWHEAAHHLHDEADNHPGRMRREAAR